MKCAILTKDFEAVQFVNGLKEAQRIIETLPCPRDYIILYNERMYVKVWRTNDWNYWRNEFITPAQAEAEDYWRTETWMEAQQY